MNTQNQIFGYEKIIDLRKLCLKKQGNISSKEIFEEERFFEIISKLNYRYPLLHFSEFLNDFFSGYFTKKLIKKHHLNSGIELWYIIESIFKMEPRREKSKTKTALKQNLEIKKNTILYQIFFNLSKKYSTELSLSYNYNLLRTFLILYFIETNSKSFEKKEILSFITSNFKIVKTLEIEFIRNSFLHFLETDIENKIQKIIKHLKNMNLISLPRANRVYIHFSKSEISDSIFKIINNSKAGIYFDNFKRSLVKKHLFLLLIPEMGLWETLLIDLEKTGKIVQIKAYWKYSPARDQLFTKNNLEFMLELIRKDEQEQAKYGKTKFFGRSIKPDDFIAELNELEKGDFEANDDQVTRIAGLVLAESVKLQAPHENIPMFDFSIDMKNYRFRPEQMDAMKKLDFQLISEIIHCKVMINEKINKKLLSQLKNYLPKNHQGVIISFMSIPNSLKSDLNSDKTIQIINEEGLKIWASITSLIPSRISSISKIMFDPFNDLMGNIARIDSMNYETGMANVTLIPSGDEFNVYIRSLQEIPLFVTPQNYFTCSKNYYKFLEILSNLTDDENFKTGIFKNQILSYEKKSKQTWIFKTLSNNVKIQLFGNSTRDCLECDCFSWQNESSQLCSHLVSCLDCFARDGGFLDDEWGHNDLNHVLDMILSGLVHANLDVLLLDMPKNKHPFLSTFFDLKLALKKLSD